MKRLPKEYLTLRRAIFAQLREKFGISESQLRRHLPNKLAAIQFVVSSEGYRAAPGTKLKKAEYATHVVNLVSALDGLEVAIESGSRYDLVQAALLVGRCEGQFQSRGLEGEARKRGARQSNRKRRSTTETFIAASKKFRASHMPARGSRPLSLKELYAEAPNYWSGPPPIALKTFYKHVG